MLYRESPFIVSAVVFSNVSCKYDHAQLDYIVQLYFAEPQLDSCINSFAQESHKSMQSNNFISSAEKFVAEEQKDEEKIISKAFRKVKAVYVGLWIVKGLKMTLMESFYLIMLPKSYISILYNEKG